MSSSMDYAFPAGDESDTSNDEWDVGCCPDKTSPRIKDLDAVVSHTEDDVSLLKRAISKGDIGTVEQLLDKGMDVETRLSFEWTPLMCAVSVANYDLAVLLLDRGASANFSKDHWTVLMASCTASASEDKIAHCVELLLSRNADPNMVDRCQVTCLMLAARDGYSKVINLLVSHGAEINYQDHNGYTALCIAVQYGREEAVLKLLQLGADKTVTTHSGKSPANLATIFKHTQVPKLRFDVCCRDENDITWSYLLTMEKEDLEKIGITDAMDQQKVLDAVQLMHLDKVDLDTISQLGTADCGSEELYNFLISLRQQCCYLTETIQDVISRFPRQTSQLVFSLDPNKETQTVCNQLVVQTNDLQKEVTCLRKLLCKVQLFFQNKGSRRKASRGATFSC
uniref:Uncharacterized protein n=1 Tax=Anabas testudineus TaxID=64144 RepID=A0A3Q1HAV9_ANATE